MSTITSQWLTCTMLCVGLSTSLQSFGADSENASQHHDAVATQWSLLDNYCVGCHNLEDWAGSLAFDTLSADNVGQNAAIWETAMAKLRGRLMPPPGNDRPSETELDAFVHGMERYLDTLASDQKANAGHIAVHRLNRKEYENAIEDILAFKVDAEALLPADTVSDGFDNVANVLQVSPSFLEQYFSAARAISIQAIGEAAPAPDVASFEAPSLATQYRHVEGLPLGTRGGFAAEHYFPAQGEYEFNIEIASQEGSLQRSYPTWWLESEHRFILTIDEVEVYSATLGGHADAEAVDRLQTPAITEIQNRFANIRLPVSAGMHTVGVSFAARSFAESDRIVDHISPGEGMDNIPVIVAFKAVGPFNAVGLADVPSRNKIFSCYPTEASQQRSCARDIMARLARQAFRRPVGDSDLEPLMQFYESGQEQGGFETGIQKAIMAMLGSTKFLYRAEPVPEDAKPGQSFPLTDLELASRLAYFLWSRSPDEELLQLAEHQQLSDSTILQQQVRRMLADPRAQSLTRNFAFQWLRVEDIDTIDPDPRIYSEFDPDLREAFKTELALFVDSILRSDHSVLDLLSAEHSFLNERLARHYGIDHVRGSQFREVVLADQRRWGLLGKGGILMLTSYPNRTSPVLRGAYVLDTLIGTPPAAPPPGVEINLDTPPGEVVLTVRERLENHRAQPSCNQCHGVIDPMGLALENFDGIGKWRDIDRFAGSPIDAAGRLVSGQPLKGPADLRSALLERPEQFVWALSRKLLTFALGRTVEAADMPLVREITRQAAARGYRFEAIVQSVVASDAFRMKSVSAEQHPAQGNAVTGTN